MSQAGLNSFSSLPPSVPLQFDEDTGIAIPVANILNVLGGTGIHTTGAGNTITIAATGALGQTITGDTGGPLPPTAGNWNIIAGLSTINSGSTVKFAGAGSTLTLDVSDASSNTIVGSGAGNATLTAIDSTGFGFQALHLLTSGTSNHAFGFGALGSVSSGSFNCGFGAQALNHILTDSNNAAFGQGALFNLNGGSENTAVGSGAGGGMTSGADNVCIGFKAMFVAASTASNNTFVGTFSGFSDGTGANNVGLGYQSLGQITSGAQNIGIGYFGGYNYTSAESSNIAIGNMGTVADGNTIRIGTQGGGAGQQNKCFIAGIASVSVSNLNLVTIDTTTGQLGSEATSSFGQTITGDTGGARSPTAGNWNITANPNGGASVLFAGSGSTLNLQVTDANGDTFIGNGAGNKTLSGLNNTSVGNFTLISLTSGSDNVVVGGGCGGNITTGSFNVGVGYQTLNTLIVGAANVAMGYQALGAVLGSNNVAIGYQASKTMGNSSYSTAVGFSAMRAETSGDQNTFIGAFSGQFVVGSTYNSCLGYSTLGTATGAASYNICIGQLAGNGFGTNESSNIVIANTGTAADNNTIRIGTAGSGNGQQNKCFIAGIDGVNVGSVATVVTESGTQLGTAVITAGTGITVTPGANTITIAATGTTNLTVTSVNHAASPYTVLSTDEFLAVNTSGGVVTVKLPNAPSTGRVYYVKDSNGTAAASNISVTTVGGVVTIDGATTYTMATNYQAISVIFDGTSYEVF